MISSLMYRLWLIFSQAATIAVAALFVVSTFRPEWLPPRAGAQVPLSITQPSSAGPMQVAARAGPAPASYYDAVQRADAQNLPAIGFGSSDALRVGDVVLAIGNPFGVGQTVTSGIVSALGRTGLGINTFENFIQTDAAINPGNSGGALVDAAGNLIGINTAIFSRSGGSMGIGFAIPVSTAKMVLEQIVRSGSVTRGWIGVEVQEVTPPVAESFKLQSTRGALVAGVLRGGPADKA